MFSRPSSLITTDAISEWEAACISPGCRFKIIDLIFFIVVLCIPFSFGLYLENEAQRERIEREECSRLQKEKEDLEKLQQEETDRLYAEKKIAEAENELANFKAFIHSIEQVTQRKYSSLNNNSNSNDSYDNWTLKQLTSIDIDLIIDELSNANDYYYSNDYKTATKLAKYTLKYIENHRKNLNKQITDLGLRISEASNSEPQHETSSSSYNGPEYGMKEEWVNCMECHGSGECKYCNGVGKNWYGNEYSTCVVCHGSKNCPMCYGTGGHYETRQYRIR